MRPQRVVEMDRGELRHEREEVGDRVHVGGNPDGGRDVAVGGIGVDQDALHVSPGERLREVGRDERGSHAAPRAVHGDDGGALLVRPRSPRSSWRPRRRGRHVLPATGRSPARRPGSRRGAKRPIRGCRARAAQVHAERRARSATGGPPRRRGRAGAPPRRAGDRRRPCRRRARRRCDRGNASPLRRRRSPRARAPRGRPPACLTLQHRPTTPTRTTRVARGEVRGRADVPDGPAHQGMRTLPARSPAGRSPRRPISRHTPGDDATRGRGT